MIQEPKIKIRKKKLDDLFNDYAWRIDPDLAKFDARPAQAVPFNDFLASYVQEMNPKIDSRRFAIETLDGKQIGNCMYFNLDRKASQVEIGIMIGNRDYWNQSYGADATKALLDHVFNNLPVTTVYLHTLNWNVRAQHSFYKCGFTVRGFVTRDGHSFIRMETTRDRWLASQNKKGSANLG